MWYCIGELAETGDGDVGDVTGGGEGRCRIDVGENGGGDECPGRCEGELARGGEGLLLPPPHTPCMPRSQHE